MISISPNPASSSASRRAASMPDSLFSSSPLGKSQNSFTFFPDASVDSPRDARKSKYLRPSGVSRYIIIPAERSTGIPLANILFRHDSLTPAVRSLRVGGMFALRRARLDSARAKHIPPPIVEKAYWTRGKHERVVTLVGAEINQKSLIGRA